MIKIGNTERIPYISAFAKVIPSYASSRDTFTGTSVTVDGNTHYPVNLCRNRRIYTASTPVIDKGSNPRIAYPKIDPSLYKIFDFTNVTERSGISNWKDGELLYGKGIGATPLCRTRIFRPPNATVQRSYMEATAWGSGGSSVERLTWSTTSPYNCQTYSRSNSSPTAITSLNGESGKYWSIQCGATIPQNKTIDIYAVVCLTNLDQLNRDGNDSDANFSNVYPTVLMMESYNKDDPCKYSSATQGDHNAPIPVVGINDKIIFRDTCVTEPVNQRGMIYAYFPNGSPSVWSGGDPWDAPDSLLLSGTQKTFKQWCSEIDNPTYTQVCTIVSHASAILRGVSGQTALRYINFAVGLGNLTSHITSGRCVGISKYYVGVRII